ncbi:MAG: signal recognition particle protein [Oscillospiraceae bacterium]|jgi:signal recognition particle subunit SRP54|nr:signal recognition particle protein [Oscillospiraceae bacterium]
MAFENLGERLNGIFKKLRGKGRLNEKDIQEAMREVRLALLEADVSYKVVREFCAAATERCKGADVLESLTPGQMVVKIVREQLIGLMGGEPSAGGSSAAKIQLSSRPPTVVMLAGLQGAGKTTNGAKLAGYFKRQGKRPLLVACDVYRPAAIKQLQVVGAQLGVPVYEEGQGDPVKIAQNAVEHAQKHGNDMVFLDTAGRLHIDEELMDELGRIKEAVRPHEILLAVDAMTGQDAVNAAQAFNESLGIDGILLTKLDGDARGGAALSARAVTGKPVKFCGVGEKLDQIEPFYPERMANRILGMGDMLTLIEKAEQAIDQKKAEQLEKNLRAGRFTLNDFLDQMGQLRGMGSMQDVMGMLPGMDKHALKNAKFDERSMNRMEAIVLSMTPKERENPSILNSSRKRRVAAGSGTRVEEINRLLKQFEMMKALAKQMAGGKVPKNLRGLLG